MKDVLTFAGLDATSSPEDVPPGSFVLAENVRYKLGSVYSRKGYEQNSSLGTGEPVKLLKRHPHWNLLFAASGTKILYRYSTANTWYDTGLTRTDTEEGMLAHTKDLFVNNQADGCFRVAMGGLGADVASGGTVITVSSGDIDQFAASGDGYIDGDSFSYSGKSGDTLTGVTGLSTDHTAGAVIVQTSDLSGAVPKGTMMAALEGSMLVAGNPTHPDTVYYSSPSTPTNPEYFYDFTSANGGGAKKLSGEITALYGASEITVIGMKDSLLYSPGFLINNGAAAGLITRPLSKTDGVPNNQCISDMDGLIVCNTGRAVLTIYADQQGASVQRSSDPRKNFDYGVSGWLKDAQSASYVAYDPTLREIHAKVSKDIPYTLVYCRDAGGWSVDSKSFNCLEWFDGRMYAGSDTDDTVYLDSEGRTDDGQTIRVRLRTGGLSVEGGLSTADVLNFIHSGMTSALAEFIMRIYVDGNQLLEQDITAERMQELGLMTVPDSGGGMGGSSLAGSSMGGGSADESYRFVLPLEFKVTGQIIQFEWDSQTEGTYLELRKGKLSFDSVGALDLSNY